MLFIHQIYFTYLSTRFSRTWKFHKPRPCFQLQTSSMVTESKLSSVTPRPQEHHSSNWVFCSVIPSSSLNLFGNQETTSTILGPIRPSHGHQSCFINPPNLFSDCSLWFLTQTTISRELLRLHLLQFFFFNASVNRFFYG